MNRKLDLIKEYILKSDSDRFDIKLLVDMFETNERTVREAYYSLREAGIVCIRKGDFIILINNDNRQRFENEVNDLMDIQYKSAMTAITRYNRMKKSLPEHNQIELPNLDYENI